MLLLRQKNNRGVQNSYTLDLAVAEITNVAWKKMVFGGDSAEIVGKALSKCIEFITSVCQVVRSVELYNLAFKIAVEKRITAYDALFIAASKKYGAKLVTLIESLLRKSMMSCL